MRFPASRQDPINIFVSPSASLPCMPVLASPSAIFLANKGFAFRIRGAFCLTLLNHIPHCLVPVCRPGVVRLRAQFSPFLLLLANFHRPPCTDVLCVSCGDELSIAYISLLAVTESLAILTILMHRVVANWVLSCWIGVRDAFWLCWSCVEEESACYCCQKHHSTIPGPCVFSFRLFIP